MHTTNERVMERCGLDDERLEQETVVVGNASWATHGTYRSAQGMSAIPLRAKQGASPSSPV